MENQPEFIKKIIMNTTEEERAKAIEIAEDLFINGTGRTDCKPIGLLNSEGV